MRVRYAVTLFVGNPLSMKYLLFLIVLAILLSSAPAHAQLQEVEAEPPFIRKSPGKAAAMSLLVPGLGHRYVHNGSWRGAASFFALAEATFWLGLIGAEWQQGQAVESYRTLATARANAQLDGKDRRFLLNIGIYMSSDEFREEQLRSRFWNEVNYVSDPAFQWEWASTEDFEDYRRLRDDADAWGRRRTLFISTLVANRLVAALTALRAARRNNSADPALSLSLAPPQRYAQYPTAHLVYRF